MNKLFLKTFIAIFKEEWAIQKKMIENYEKEIAGRGGIVWHTKYSPTPSRLSAFLNTIDRIRDKKKAQKAKILRAEAEKEEIKHLF